jgi:mono/diheme cytochrome c family protein
MSVKSRLVLGSLVGSLLLGAAHPAKGEAANLSVVWGVTGPEQELKSWDFQALGKLKTATTQVDLVIIKSTSGGQVLLPRSVVTKYPVLLALQDGKTSLVLPWTSKPKIMQEGLPVESYFIGDVSRVELSNYRDRFGSVFLRRRTDPLAMRGEKIFVQNCIGCHAGAQPPSIVDVSGETQSRRLASSGHPQVKGIPKLNDRDRKALVNYLDAYRAENPVRAGHTEVKGASHAALPLAVFKR